MSKSQREVKPIKPIIHFYFPEASSRGSKIDICEHFFIKHSFHRNVTKAGIEYYAKDHQTDFDKAFKNSLKKKSDNPNDMFYIILDTDISPNRDNIDDVIKQIVTLNRTYKDKANIILSSRSFEVWLCMYGRESYTAPYVSQKKLNESVENEYEKTDAWYLKNSNWLYQDSQKAMDASKLSKKIVFKGTDQNPPEGHDLVNNKPDFSDGAVVSYLAKTAPYTYFELVIDILKKYE